MAESQCGNSLNISPIFLVTKKQGQGLRAVQDFHELNNHSHIDKYSMKEIAKCIGDIGLSNLAIFSTLDLTARFWPMQLDEQTQPLTALIIPGKGQYHHITNRSFALLSEFPTPHGGGPAQHYKCHNLYWQLTHPHKNAWGTSPDFW